MASTIHSQDIFDEQLFFKNLEESYYTLNKTSLQNFTVLVNNNITEEFAANNWNNADIFPVQFIWLSTGKMFLSDQGAALIENDSLRTVYNESVADLKKQITGLLGNLSNFYFEGLYKSISPDYQLNHIDDQVEIKFINTSSIDTSFNTFYFGLNGLCIKILNRIPAQNATLEIYPSFKIVKTKWLITSWRIQISKNGEIESGVVFSLKNKLINDIWVPEEITVTVQKADKLGSTFGDIIKFKNYLFNQPLQYMDGSK